MGELRHTQTQKMQILRIQVNKPFIQTSFIPKVDQKPKSGFLQFICRSSVKKYQN